MLQKTKPLEEFFAKLYVALEFGDLEYSASQFQCPLVIYQLDGLVVLQNESDLARYLRQYFDALVRARVKRRSIKILETETPSEGRIKAVVESYEFDANEQKVGSGRVRYFLAQKGQEFRIELAEILRQPLTTAS